MKVLFVLSLLFPCFSFGFESSYENIKTSDSIRSQIFRAKETIRGYSLSGETQQVDYLAGFQRIHSLGISKMFFESGNSGVLLGGKLVDIDGDENHRIRGLGEIKLNYSGEKWNLNGGFRQVLPVQTVSVLNSNFTDVREDELHGFFSFHFVEKLKFQSSQSLGFRSDGPRKVGADTALFYGVSPGWPWIWVGYGFSYLAYSERSPAYWSPKNFTTHGLRIDSSFPIFKELSGIFGVNFNNYDEDGFKGRGHYGVGGLQWGPSQGNHVKLTWTEIRSGQSSSPWRYDGLMLSFQLLDK